MSLLSRLFSTSSSRKADTTAEAPPAKSAAPPPPPPSHQGEAERSEDTAKRHRQRASRAFGGEFLQAADSSNTSAHWGRFPATAGLIIEREWLPTVARSRDVCQNNPHGAKFLSMGRNNIPGPDGFRLYAHVKNPGGKKDKKANEAIEEAWKIQRKRENWDIEGIQSGAMMDKMAVASFLQDGEAIAVIEMGEDTTPTRFGVRMVDPITLEPNFHENLPNGNRIRHGIEIDRRGRPVAYHFRVAPDEHLGALTYYGDKYERVPAEYVVHVFLPFMVGAKRGLPAAKAAMWRMRQLGAYEDASVVKARVAASDMMLLEDQDGDDETEDYEFEAEPGSARTLPSGYKPHFWNPSWPTGDLEPFTRKSLQAVASGLDVAYHSLASDLSAVNFSSIRQGTIEERKMWLSFQLFFEEVWCQRIYKLWLEHALLSNRLQISGRPLSLSRIERYQSVSFIGRRWDWIDPATEIKALEAEAALRTKSRSAAIRERGGDPSDVWAEIAEEEAEMRELGLDPTINKAGAAPAKGTEEAKEKSTKEES